MKYAEIAKYISVLPISNKQFIVSNKLYMSTLIITQESTYLSVLIRVTYYWFIDLEVKLMTINRYTN